MTSLPANPSPTKLGLVIDLDICVGCHACAVNCKEWNTVGYHAPLTDLDAYGAEPDGVWFNRIHSYDVDGAREVVNEKTGILLPSPHTMDPRSRSIALAEAITELAADPVRRATLGAAGRELCRTRFDYHTMAAQLDALYCALLEGDAS